MTQSVADKTPIPAKTDRRHTDPPGLWIAVTIGSVTLHLLLFWLLRSYLLSLWSQQRSSTPIAIEFVESQQAPSLAKPVSSKQRATTQKSAPVSSPKQVTPTNEDSNAIALTNKTETALPQQPLKARSIEQKKPQPNSKPTIKPDLTPKPQPIPEQNTPDNQQPQTTPEPKTPNANQQPLTPQQKTPDNTATETQNQENQTSSEQNQPGVPQNNTTDSTNTDSSTDPAAEKGGQQPPPSANLPGQPGGDVTVGKATPLEDAPPVPPINPEQSPSPLENQQGRGSTVATWGIEADALQKDIPENLAKPIGSSREKELNFLSLNRELDSQPLDFPASLIIDSTGNLVDVFINPAIPEPQRSQYREYALAVFKGEKFIPATSSDGKKPPLSNLVIRITIQRKSP